MSKGDYLSAVEKIDTLDKVGFGVCSLTDINCGKLEYTVIKMPFTLLIFKVMNA